MLSLEKLKKKKNDLNIEVCLCLFMFLNFDIECYFVLNRRDMFDVV